VDGTKVSWGYVPGPLAPGASVTIDSSGGGPYTIPPGTHTIGVLVDDVDRIAGTNNCNQVTYQSRTLSSTCNIPDLIPPSLSYYSSTRLFSFFVRNEGTPSLPAFPTRRSSDLVDGTKVSWGYVPGPLAPGASVTIDSSGGGPYTIPSGTHTIGVLVDDVD